MTTPATALPRKTTLPPLVLADGTVEALKWLALVLMTIDHINRFLLADTQPWMFALGRLTLPIFASVLAYNLARLGALERGIYKRTLGRLLLFGLLATPSYIAIGGAGEGGLWQFNIMFCFAAMVACIWLIDLERTWASSTMVLVFALSGFLVEYLWFGIGFGIAVWYYCRRPSRTAAAFIVLFCAALNVFVLSFWSLLALPLVFLAHRIDLRVPRLRLAFYAYYPLHFAAIWYLQRTTMPGAV